MTRRETNAIVNNGATQRPVCFILLAILVCGSRIVVAGPELPAADGKDYSKEVVPVEKSWCETPKPFEIRIGAPGWLAGISGESGSPGIGRLCGRQLQPAFSGI